MKPNIWNVKDILSIPVNSTSAKPLKGGAPSDYSSLPDSQFLFGSQTWPENSQSFSQEINGQSRGSQQASQEVNETKVSSIYHSKPMLFVDSKVPNNTSGRALGILDRFEEEKRKAKETEILLGIRQLYESLENIQKTFLNCIDGSCDITRAAVAEGMNQFRTTIQDNFKSQTELLMSQMCKEMKDTEAKTSLALKDLSSLIVSLQQDLESLKLEQSKEQSLLGEIVSLLGTIMTAYPSGAQLRHGQMIDNTVQTSPSLVSQFCVVSEKKHDYESMKLCGKSFSYSEKREDQSICPTEKPPEKLGREVSYRVISTQPFQKQPHTQTVRSAPSSRQKAYHLWSVANSSPSPSATNTDTALLQDAKKTYMVGGHVLVEPVKSLTDRPKNNSATWIEVPREKKVLKRGPRCLAIKKNKRALILPRGCPNHRFEETKYNKDEENMVPQSVVSTYQKASKGVSGNHPPLQQMSTNRLMNMSVCEQHVEPCRRSLSQSSNSSQVIVEYQKAKWKTVRPEQKANTIQRQSVTWQLFDFVSDSD